MSFELPPAHVATATRRHAENVLQIKKEDCLYVIMPNARMRMPDAHVILPGKKRIEKYQGLMLRGIHNLFPGLGVKVRAIEFRDYSIVFEVTGDVGNLHQLDDAQVKRVVRFISATIRIATCNVRMVVN